MSSPAVKKTFDVDLTGQRMQELSRTAQYPGLYNFMYQAIVTAVNDAWRDAKKQEWFPRELTVEVPVDTEDPGALDLFKTALETAKEELGRRQLKVTYVKVKSGFISLMIASMC